MVRIGVILCIVAALISCGGKGSSLDQAIQLRAAYNAALGSFYTELSTAPIEVQKEYAAKALPIVATGKIALDTMDATVAGGAAITPENVQQIITAKNALIDMVAALVVKKGGKS